MKTFFIFCSLLHYFNALSQVSQVCINPTDSIYGLTTSGAIYPISITNAAVGPVTKNTTYTGSSPNNSNAIGFRHQSFTFYYFKRYPWGSTEQFVSFVPSTNTVTVLASSPFNNSCVRGCVSADGSGYYALGDNNRLGYYSIASNTWTIICSTFTDQYENSVTPVMNSNGSGDIAIDGQGNLWIVLSSTTTFALYKLPAPLPTSPVSSLQLTQLLPPVTPTPGGNIIAGIAFNPTGLIFLSTPADDKLYRLENNLTTTYIGTFTTSGVGADLTSCHFPSFVIIPLNWHSFLVQKQNNHAFLTWATAGENKTIDFTVQHSTDGIKWNKIGTVLATGYSTSIMQYSYSHITPSGGLNYYRIWQRDMNNNHSYSQIRSVRFGKEDTELEIIGNPVLNGTLQILVKGSSVQPISLYNSAGRCLLNKQIVPGLNRISVSCYPGGIYCLKTADKTEKIILK